MIPSLLLFVQTHQFIILQERKKKMGLFGELLGAGAKIVAASVDSVLDQKDKERKVVTNTENDKIQKIEEKIKMAAPYFGIEQAQLIGNKNTQEYREMAAAYGQEVGEYTDSFYLCSRSYSSEDWCRTIYYYYYGIEQTRIGKKIMNVINVDKLERDDVRIGMLSLYDHHNVEPSGVLKGWIPEEGEPYLVDDSKIGMMDFHEFLDQNYGGNEFVKSVYYSTSAYEDLMLTNEQAEEFYKIFIEYYKYYYSEEIDRYLTTYLRVAPVLDDQFNAIEYRTRNEEIFVHNSDFWNRWFVYPEKFLEVQEYHKVLKDYLRDSKELGLRIAGIFAGITGEQEIGKELDFYKNSLRILDNIRVELNNESCECDTIIVSENGVFILETKNYGAIGSGKNFSLEISSDGRWRKIFTNGKVENIDSIGRQNQRHVYAISTILSEALGKEVPVYSLIVFANDKIDIINNSKNVIIRKSEIMTEIFTHEKKNDREMLEEIERVLQDRNLPAKPYAFPHPRIAMENLKWLRIGISEHIKKYGYLLRRLEEDMVQYDMWIDAKKRALYDCHDKNLDMIADGLKHVQDIKHQDVLLKLCTDHYCTER